METKSVEITFLSGKEFLALFEPLLKECGVHVDGFEVHANRLIPVASCFLLEGPSDSFAEVIKEQEVGRVLWGYQIAELLAVLAGEGKIPKTEYVITDW
jgi:hypothetical protein